MKLVVGLGNVGSRYDHTRHNIGFMVADQLARELGASWKSEPKLKSAVAQADYGDERILFLKPQTMMNLSGLAVAAASHFYKVSPEDTWVIFDDLDVPFGKLRVRSAGTSGGHQGVASTISAIGTGFMRARMGISMNNRAVEPSEVYVLAPFNAQEKDRLKPVIEAASAKLLVLISTDVVEDSTFDLA